MNTTITKAAATLVVVDVQPCEFKAARHPVLQQAVRDLVANAVALNWDIIVLEYKGAGSSLLEVNELLADYTRKEFIQKDTDSGGEEVWLALAENGFAYKHMFICGCNTHGCVQDTTSDLAALIPDACIAVVKSACNDDRGNTWSRFRCAANVSLVEDLN